MGFVGLLGPLGDVGLVGNVGPVGRLGQVGDDGPVGEVGPLGNEGLVGVVGPVGCDGIVGVVGALGDVGPLGNDGLVGKDGPVGTLGPVGNEGLVGVLGPVGDVGSSGDDGPDGKPGPLGEAGPHSAARRASISLMELIVFMSMMYKKFKVVSYPGSVGSSVLIWLFRLSADPCSVSIRSRSDSHAASFNSVALENVGTAGPLAPLKAANEASVANSPIEASTCAAESVLSVFSVAGITNPCSQAARF